MAKVVPRARFQKWLHLIELYTLTEFISDKKNIKGSFIRIYDSTRVIVDSIFLATVLSDAVGSVLFNAGFQGSLNGKHIVRLYV